MPKRREKQGENSRQMDDIIQRKQQQKKTLQKKKYRKFFYCAVPEYKRKQVVEFVDIFLLVVQKPIRKKKTTNLKSL